MSSSGLIFEPIYNLTPILLSQLQQIILTNIFTHQNKDIQLTLTPHYIFVYQIQDLRVPTHYCHLNFQVKFQILHQNQHFQQKLEIPYGLRLQKEMCRQKLVFQSNNSMIINIWSLQLQKKINQRNFHKLFKAKKKIGKGAFATVYLAQRLRDNKLVAVKAFSKQKQYDSDKGKESLLNEIKLMRQLNHENLIKLQGVYQTQNSIYIILQYLQGKQLNQYLKENKSLQKNQIKQIMKNLLKGLSHLNKKNIIHRDLKPQNIMFKRNGQLIISICDFGLATYADQQNYLFVRCGTPGFVAPEIINIKDLSTKSNTISDVFSAGLIFHYLLFGSSLFQGKKYNQILLQNRLCDFNFNKDIYSKLNFNVYDLLTKMLQVDPNKRITVDQALNHVYFCNQMDIEPFQIENTFNFKQNTLKKMNILSDSYQKKYNTLQKSPKRIFKRQSIQYTERYANDQPYYSFY